MNLNLIRRTWFGFLAATVALVGTTASAQQYAGIANMSIMTGGGGGPATISQYTSLASWSSIGGSTVVGTENFLSYSGFYSSPLAGSIGPYAWMAGALGGIYVGTTGPDRVLSTNSPTSLVIEFSSGVTGVGGNIFNTDINFNFLGSAVTVVVTLWDLSTATFTQSSIGSQFDWWGFHSTGADIASITISAGGAPAVPLPGAMGLAACGLLGLNRRRRR